MPKYRKEIDVLVKAARSQGWRYEQRPGKHPVLFPNDSTKPPIPVPISLSDWRGYQNFRSVLRQAGLDV